MAVRLVDIAWDYYWRGLLGNVLLVDDMSKQQINLRAFSCPSTMLFYIQIFKCVPYLKEVVNNRGVMAYPFAVLADQG